MSDASAHQVKVNHSPGMQILHSCMCRQRALSHHPEAQKQRCSPDVAQAAWQHGQAHVSMISLMACSSHNKHLNRDPPLAACRAMAARTRLLSTLCCLSFMRPVRREEPRTYSKTLAGLSYRHRTGHWFKAGTTMGCQTSRLSPPAAKNSGQLFLALLQQPRLVPQRCDCAGPGGLQLPALLLAGTRNQPLSCTSWLAARIACGASCCCHCSVCCSPALPDCCWGQLVPTLLKVAAALPAHRQLDNHQALLQGDTKPAALSRRQMCCTCKAESVSAAVTFMHQTLHSTPDGSLSVQSPCHR